MRTCLNLKVYSTNIIIIHLPHDQSLARQLVIIVILWTHVWTHSHTHTHKHCDRHTHTQTNYINPPSCMPTRVNEAYKLKIFMRCYTLKIMRGQCLFELSGPTTQVVLLLVYDIPIIALALLLHCPHVNGRIAMCLYDGRG